MCGGVEYPIKGKDIRVYFPNPKAMLPVQQDREIELMIWGRRRDQPGRLPPGGWARQESLDSGKWDKYFPRPVKIIVNRFMEKDKNRVSHWFDLTRGQWIQGLIANYKNEQRVYVVTIKPELPDAIHDRWPKIMSG